MMFLPHRKGGGNVKQKLLEYIATIYKVAKIVKVVLAVTKKLIELISL